MNSVQSISIVIVASCLAVIPALAQKGFGPPPGPGLPTLEWLDREPGCTDAQGTDFQTLLNARRNAGLTLARAQRESRIYLLLTADQQQKAQEWVAQMQQQSRRVGGQ